MSQLSFSTIAIPTCQDISGHGRDKERHKKNNICTFYRYSPQTKTLGSSRKATKKHLIITV